jgi:hypothetical protein
MDCEAQAVARLAFPGVALAWKVKFAQGMQPRSESGDGAVA